MTFSEKNLDFARIDYVNECFEHGAVKYLHSSVNRSGTAYEIDEKIILELLLPVNLGARCVKVHLLSEDLKNNIATIDAIWSSKQAFFDNYTVNIPAEFIASGLYFFYIEIYGISHFFGTKEKGGIKFSNKPGGEKFQLSVCDFKYPVASDRFGGVIYHIFVDRFSKGGKVPKRQNAILVKDWNEDIPEFPEYPGAFLKNNYFYGGTLYGIIDKLDYIISLGVNIIYLSPIFEAYSNHKYDVGNYNKIDDMFGGEDALLDLISACNEKGIAIVLDGVFNHTGADSVYFNKFSTYNTIGAYQSKESPFYNWYDFQNYPDKYTAWWGIDILPRINPNIQSCCDFFAGENGIVEKYTSMGIKGFRLDVVDELSDEFIASIRKAQTRRGNNTFLYGEVWEDASNKIAYDKRKQYYLGAELDGVMNYPIRTGIIDYVRDKKIESIEYAIFEVLFNMPKRIRDLTMNLLGTHDTERILTVLGGASSDGKSNAELRDIRMSKEAYEIAKRRLMIAYTILATIPGIPTVFYGDEAGLEGYSDPFNRRTYPWDNVDNDIFNFYQRIGKIRSENKSYKEGDFHVYALNKDCFVFSRKDENNYLLTVINNSFEDMNIVFDLKTTELISGRKAESHVLKLESASIFKVDLFTTFEIL